jgi:hypothetical protein
MATEAAWLKRKKEKTSNKKGKRKTDLTLTGLLMEGLNSVWGLTSSGRRDERIRIFGLISGLFSLKKESERQKR